MSHSTSITKIIFDPSHLRTPKGKEIPSSSEQIEDEIYNPPILMDEFGQTPDHFYLARKPPSFFQVKRKLNLQTMSSRQNSEEGVRKSTRRRRKIDSKPKAKKVSKARYDTSLGQLTKRFLKLLSDAADGVINLNTACTLLSVPKRRLYDITNVLEGAGLIQKTSRNNIQWMGRVSAPTNSNAAMYDLEKEIDILEAKENKLDELIYHMKSEIKTFKEYEENYLYITSDELKKLEEYSASTLIGVKLAPGEQVIESSEKKLLLTSKTTELAAFLVSEDASFVDILHPRVEFKENSFKVQISNSLIAGLVKQSDELDKDHYGNENDSTFAQLYSEAVWSEGFMSGPSYSQSASGSTWGEGEMMRNAFIADEDDIAPLSRNFLLQTEDQNMDLPFPSIEFEDNYSFSLDDGEGLADLYDCQYACP